MVTITAKFDLPAHQLPLFTAIKKGFGINDDKMVSDCVRFALFMYQQGLVGKSNTLMDSLVNQVGAFDALRERIEQSAAAAKQAAFVSSAVVTSLQQELLSLRVPTQE